MGKAKLLLKIGGKTVVARLLDALAEAGIRQRLVVIDPEDACLRAEVEAHHGLVVAPPVAPPDMRTSIAHGIEAVAIHWGADRTAPDPDFPWLLIPADHPAVSATTVKHLIRAAHNNPRRILIPTYRGRRGHPTVFAWRHAEFASQIPSDRGFNWVIERCAEDVLEIEMDGDDILIDLDTPADYERLRSIWSP